MFEEKECCMSELQCSRQSVGREEYLAKVETRSCKRESQKVNLELFWFRFTSSRVSPHLMLHPPQVKSAPLSSTSLPSRRRRIYRDRQAPSISSPSQPCKHVLPRSSVGLAHLQQVGKALSLRRPILRATHDQAASATQSISHI